MAEGPKKPKTIKPSEFSSAYFNFLYPTKSARLQAKETIIKEQAAANNIDISNLDLKNLSDKKYDEIIKGITEIGEKEKYIDTANRMINLGMQAYNVNQEVMERKKLIDLYYEEPNLFAEDDTRNKTLLDAGFTPSQNRPLTDQYKEFRNSLPKNKAKLLDNALMYNDMMKRGQTAETFDNTSIWDQFKTKMREIGDKIPLGQYSPTVLNLFNSLTSEPKTERGTNDIILDSFQKRTGISGDRFIPKWTTKDEMIFNEPEAKKDYDLFIKGIKGEYDNVQPTPVENIYQKFFKGLSELPITPTGARLFTYKPAKEKEELDELNTIAMMMNGQTAIPQREEGSIEKIAGDVAYLLGMSPAFGRGRQMGKEIAPKMYDMKTAENLKQMFKTGDLPTTEKLVTLGEELGKRMISTGMTFELANLPETKDKDTGKSMQTGMGFGLADAISDAVGTMLPAGKYSKFIKPITNAFLTGTSFATGSYIGGKLQGQDVNVLEEFGKGVGLSLTNQLSRGILKATNDFVRARELSQNAVKNKYTAGEYTDPQGRITRNRVVSIQELDDTNVYNLYGGLKELQIKLQKTAAKTENDTELEKLVNTAITGLEVPTEQKTEEIQKSTYDAVQKIKELGIVTVRNTDDNDGIFEVLSKEELGEKFKDLTPVKVDINKAYELLKRSDVYLKGKLDEAVKNIDKKARVTQRDTGLDFAVLHKTEDGKYILASTDNPEIQIGVTKENFYKEFAPQGTEIRKEEKLEQGVNTPPDKEKAEQPKLPAGTETTIEQIDKELPTEPAPEKGKIEKDYEAAIEQLGITPEEKGKEEKQEPIKPEPPKEQMPGQSKLKIQDVPIADINTNVDLFQNRDEEYSEDSVNSIIKAVKNGTFDINKFDPIRIWKNPEDGKYYVLAGHSRLEAFNRLSNEGLEYYSTIPAIEMQGKTKDEARKFAIEESNTLGTQEQLTARAKIYRKMREDGYTKQEIHEAAEKEKGNRSRVLQLSQLNPKGSTISAYKKLESGDLENKTQIEKMASIIAKARDRYEDLTDSHEEEMYDYLKKNLEKFKNSTEFFEQKLMPLLEADKGRFNYRKPLNLNNVAETPQEAEYRRILRQYENDIKQAELELKEQRDRLTREKLSVLKPFESNPEKYREEEKKLDAEINKRLEQIRLTIDRLQQEKIKHEGSYGKWIEASQNQGGLFGAPEETPAAGPSKEDALKNARYKVEEEIIFTRKAGLQGERTIEDKAVIKNVDTDRDGNVIYTIQYTNPRGKERKIVVYEDQIKGLSKEEKDKGGSSQTDKTQHDEERPDDIKPPSENLQQEIEKRYNGRFIVHNTDAGAYHIIDQDDMNIIKIGNPKTIPEYISRIDEYIKEKERKAKYSGPRGIAIAKLTGAAVDRIEQKGYVFVQGNLIKGSKEFNLLVGFTNGAAADRLLGKGVTIKEKESQKPVEKGSKAYPVVEAYNKYTKVKTKYPDYIVFIPLNNSYVTFNQDSEKLTDFVKKYSKKGENINHAHATYDGLDLYMTFFPAAQAYEVWAGKLTKEGFKFVLAEQVEKPLELPSKNKKPKAEVAKGTTRYHKNLTALGKIVPIDKLREMKPGDALKFSAGGPDSGFMDFNIDKLSSDTFAFSHYYKENGDMIPDPDMTVRIDWEQGTIEALTYQDRYRYKQVYPEEGKVNLTEKKGQNQFLSIWLKNIREQGHELVTSKSEKPKPSAEEKPPSQITKKPKGFTDEENDLWEDLIEESDDKVQETTKQYGGKETVTPEKLAKGLKIVSYYIGNGEYSINNIIKKAAEKLGGKTADYLEVIKKSYLAYLSDATDEELDKMTDTKSVRKITRETLNEIIGKKEEKQENKKSKTGLELIDEYDKKINELLSENKISTPNWVTAQSRISALKNLYVRLKSSNPIKNNTELTNILDKDFHGTIAQGKYTIQEAYDLLETAVNLFIKDTPEFRDFNNPQETLDKLTEFTNLLPTQRARTQEKDEYQQFSTPPTIAFLMAYALDTLAKESILEPSAGNGGLLAFFTNNPIYSNELFERRKEMLVIQGYETSGVDAKYLDDLLPDNIKPDKEIMNPPFSANAGKSSNDTANGLRHIEQALARLNDNGRSVILFGEGLSFDKVSKTDFWKKIMEKYNVRANITLPGDAYAKYGTSFGTQLIVIDKNGATPGKTFGERLNSVISGAYDLNKILTILQGLRDTKNEARKNEQTDLGGITGGLFGTQGTPEPGRKDTEVGTGPGTGNKPPDNLVTGQGNIPAEQGTGQAGTGGDGKRKNTSLNKNPEQGDGSTGAGLRPDSIIPETNQNINKRHDETGGRFTEYIPAKLNIGKQHPAKIVESASMAAVEPPDITYKGALSQSVIDEGRLSNIQLETVFYAGQRHSVIHPNGTRAGYFIGDGTGVGKGRQIAGIILDNYLQGRKKVVWLSASQMLLESSIRDLRDVGVTQQIFNINTVNVNDKIPLNSGIVFSTYSTLISKSKTDKDKTRLKQLINWLGEDGLIILDESHKAKNALGNNLQAGTQTGAAVIELQANLPKARVVYSSATGATEIDNMIYMNRLGLWGDGMTFKDFNDFKQQIQSGGLGAMEMIARDIKALGMYCSRNISYEGVETKEVIHELTNEQETIYNTAAEVWQTIMEKIDAALDITNGRKSKSERFARQRFWNDHQRFFNQMIVALKIPTALKAIQESIDAGNSPIISLVNTGEAKTKEKVAGALSTGEDLEDLDFSPRQIVYSYVEQYFPTQLFEEQKAEDGRKIKVPVLDSNGNPVESKEALRMKEELLNRISDISIPENPLDQLVNHFGPENVAEMSGRKNRLIRDPRTGKMVYAKRNPSGVSANDLNNWEMKQFQDGKKSIALITQAAGTGISLHADRGAKNQNRRDMIVIQYSWSADVQMQIFGRHHRSNQVMPPYITLISTNIYGERRFSSSIARRLAQLGSITKGQRDAIGADDISKYNYQTKEGSAALNAMYDMILNREVVPGLDNAVRTLLDIGLAKENDDGIVDIPKETRFDVPRFLNRVLALQIDRQNALFQFFEKVFNGVIQTLKESGQFDEGLTDLKSLKTELKQEGKVIATDKGTGAKTQHFEVELTKPVYKIRFDRALKIAGEVITANKFDLKDTRKLFSFAENTLGHPILITEIEQGTNIQTGSLFRRFKIFHPNGNVDYKSQDEIFSDKKIVKFKDEKDKEDWITKQGGDFYVTQSIMRGTQKTFISEDSKVWTIRGNTAEHHTEKFLLSYKLHKPEEIQAKWEKAASEVPDTRTEKHHILSGAILPIWNKIKVTVKDSEGKDRQIGFKVVRVTTDDGKRIVGLDIPQSHIGEILSRFNISTSLKNPQEIYDGVLKSGISVMLERGITLKRSKLHGEDAIEAMLPKIASALFSTLRKAGLINEKIDFKQRFFIPTNDEVGPKVIAKLIKEFSVIGGNTSTIDTDKVQEKFAGYGIAYDSVNDIQYDYNVIPQTDKINMLRALEEREKFTRKRYAELPKEKSLRTVRIAKEVQQNIFEPVETQENLFEEIQIDDNAELRNRYEEELSIIRTQIIALKAAIEKDSGREIKYDESGTESMFVGEEIARQYKSQKPVFFSQLENIAGKKLQNKATPEQIKSTLLNNGVKQTEYDWLGLDEFMAGKEKISKDELMKFIAENKVQLKEVIKGENRPEKWTFDENIPNEWTLKGTDLYITRDVNTGKFIAYFGEGLDTQEYDTLEAAKEAIDESIDFINTTTDSPITDAKYSQYKTVGGENYREVLLTLPSKHREFSQSMHEKYGDKWVYSMTDEELQRKAILDERDNLYFQSSHFDESNIVLHLRLQDFRYNENKILLIDEMQSDWAQKGRKYGYTNDSDYETLQNLKSRQIAIRHEHQNKINYPMPGYSDKEKYLRKYLIDNVPEYAKNEKEISVVSTRLHSGVPDMPFKKNWHEVGMKWALRYAAENGYDGIAWTTGEQQAERYDLSKHLEKIKYFQNPDKTYSLRIYTKQQGEHDYFNKSAIELEALVGKDIAQKIADTHPSFTNPAFLTGLDLKIGGEGMKGFYDKILPDFMNKYVKKWGSKVEKGSIGIDRTYKEISVDEAKKLLNKGSENLFEYRTGSEDPLENGYWTIDDPEIFQDVLDNEEKFYTTELDDPKFHTVSITPAMRESVMQGQAIFETKKTYDPGQGEMPFNSQFRYESCGVGMPEEKKRKIATAVSILQEIENNYNNSLKALGADVKTHGISFMKEFVNRKFVDFRGTKIRNPEELAIMAQMLRNPYFEVFSIIYKKNGKVISHEHITSGLPGTAYIRENEQSVHQVIDKVLRTANKLGADEVFNIHNHPSGNSSPSDNDISVTKLFGNGLKDLYKGHVVTNGGEYSFINFDGSDAFIARRRQKLKVPDFYTNRNAKIDNIENLKIGTGTQAIEESHTIAQIGKAIQTNNNILNIFYLSPRQEIKAVQSVGTGLFTLSNNEKFRNYINAAKFYFGADDVIITRASTEKSWTAHTELADAILLKMVNEGELLDYVIAGKYSSHSTSSIVGKSWYSVGEDNDKFDLYGERKYYSVEKMTNQLGEYIKYNSGKMQLVKKSIKDWMRDNVIQNETELITRVAEDIVQEIDYFYDAEKNKQLTNKPIKKAGFYNELEKARNPLNKFEKKQFADILGKVNQHVRKFFEQYSLTTPLETNFGIKLFFGTAGTNETTAERQAHFITINPRDKSGKPDHKRRIISEEKEHAISRGRFEEALLKPSRVVKAKYKGQDRIYLIKQWNENSFTVINVNGNAINGAYNVIGFEPRANKRYIDKLGELEDFKERSGLSPHGPGEHQDQSENQLNRSQSNVNRTNEFVKGNFPNNVKDEESTYSEEKDDIRTDENGNLTQESFISMMKVLSSVATYIRMKQPDITIEDFTAKANDLFKRAKTPFALTEAMAKQLYESSKEITEKVTNQTTIPPGIVDRPAIPKGMKKRKFVEQVDASEDIEMTVKKAITEYAYKPIGNAETVEQAKKYIEANGIDGSIDKLLNNDTGYSIYEREAAAMILIKQLSETGRKFREAGQEILATESFEKSARTVDAVAKLFTESGRAVQIANIFKYLTPEGALFYAKRTLNRVEHKKMQDIWEWAKILGTQFDGVNGEVTNKVIEDLKDKIFNLENEIKKLRRSARRRQRRKGNKPPAGPEKTPEQEEEEDIIERIAARVSREVLQRVKIAEPDEIKELIKRLARTLVKIADETGIIPEKLKKVQREIWEDLKEALGKTKTSEQAWELAKKMVQTKLEGDEEAEELLDKFYKHILENPFSDAQVEKAVKEQLNEDNVNIAELVKQHWTIVDRTGRSFAQKIIDRIVPEELDAEIEQKIRNLERALITKFKERTEIRKQKLLDARLKNPFLRKQKSILQQLIELSNLGAFKQEAYYGIVKDKMNVKDLTAEQAEKIMQFAEEIQQLPEGSIQLERASAKMLNYIAAIKGWTTFDLAIEGFYGAVLLGIQTTFKNTAFNFMELLLAFLLRSPKTYGQALKGVFDMGLPKGLVDAAFIYAHGDFEGEGKWESSYALRSQRISEIVNQMHKLDKEGQLSASGKPTGKYSKLDKLLMLPRISGRNMIAQDRLFYWMNNEMEKRTIAYELAKNKGLSGKELTAEIESILNNSEVKIEMARQQAAAENLKPKSLEFEKRIFQIIDSGIENTIKQDAARFGAFHTLNYEPKGLGGSIYRAIVRFQTDPNGRASKFMLPFIRISTNLGNEFLNCTPWGFKRAFYGYGYGKGRETLSGRDYDIHLYRAVLGTLGMVGLLMLVKQLLESDDYEITATGTGDFNKNSQMQPIGWRPYTVEIAGKRFSYINTPFFIPLMTAGFISDLYKYRKDKTDNKSTFDIVTGLIGMTLAGFSQQSMLSGFLDFTSIFDKNQPDKPLNWFSKFTSRTISSILVPRVVSQIFSMVDDKQYTANNWVENILRNTGLAGFIGDMKPLLNRLGDEVHKDSLFFPVASKRDRVWEWIVKNQAWIPDAKKSDIIYDPILKQDREMTPDEYYRWIKTSGPLIRAGLENAISTLDEIENKDLVRQLASELYQASDRTAKGKIFGLDAIDERTTDIFKRPENFALYVQMKDWEAKKENLFNEFQAETDPEAKEIIKGKAKVVENNYREVRKQLYALNDYLQQQDENAPDKEHDAEDKKELFGSARKNKRLFK